jgi:hypothetical protein
MHVKELAPDVRPTAGFRNAVASEQLVEPGISIGVDHTAEALEVSPRMFTLAVGGVEEQCRRRPFSIKGALVPNVGP